MVLSSGTLDALAAGTIVDAVDGGALDVPAGGIAFDALVESGGGQQDDHRERRHRKRRGRWSGARCLGGASGATYNSGLEVVSGAADRDASKGGVEYIEGKGTVGAATAVDVGIQVVEAGLGLGSAALSGDRPVVAGGSATDRTVDGKDDLIEGAGFAATIARVGLEVIGVGGTATSNAEEAGLEMVSASGTIIGVDGAAYVAPGSAAKATTVESSGRWRC